MSVLRYPNVYPKTLSSLFLVLSIAEPTQIFNLPRLGKTSSDHRVISKRCDHPWVFDNEVTLRENLYMYLF